MMLSFTRHDAEVLAALTETAMEDPGAVVDRAAAAAAVAALRDGLARREPLVTVELTPAERQALKFCWDTLADGDAIISDDVFERVRAALTG